MGKNFTDSPAMQFISKESIDKVDKPEKPKKQTSEKSTPKGGRKAPEGYKPNPEFIETKSKRVQILMQPSLHSKAKEISEELGISLNDFISRAIQEATTNTYVLDQIRKDLEQ